MTRRRYLLTTIRTEGGVWTTRRAEQALAEAAFSGHRNTARKDLRSFVRDGLLRLDTVDGRRCYIPTKKGLR